MTDDTITTSASVTSPIDTSTPGRLLADLERWLRDFTANYPARARDDFRGDVLVIAHPRDFADLLGVRRTRGNMWTWRGQRWRSLAQARRRFPPRLDAGRLAIVVDHHGWVKPGRLHATNAEPFGVRIVGWHRL